MGSAFTLTPDTSKTDLSTTATTAFATTITQMNIGGTGTIIGTITIEIMIGTTTGIDRGSLTTDRTKGRYEIITFCPCAGLRRIDFSIL
jgi:hypothetical protein